MCDLMYENNKLPDYVTISQWFDLMYEHVNISKNDHRRCLLVISLSRVPKNPWGLISPNPVSNRRRIYKTSDIHT